MEEKKYSFKYPVLFVHGMGFRDNRLFNYWGRVPKMAENLGCCVFYGEQDSNGSVESNAGQLKKRVEDILKKTGAEKVNIIAHSKGGLDARFMISSLGMENSVATLTTLSTPHHGSKTVDFLLKAPTFMVKTAGFFTDCWFRIIGDKKPSSYEVFKLFTTKGAEKFNSENPDSDNVYYQSYSFVMNSPFSDIIMLVPSLAVWMIEGENDGLLTPRASEWSNYKGVYRSSSRRGISHCDEVDMRRRRFTKNKEKGISDIVDLYKKILIELSEMGY